MDWLIRQFVAFRGGREGQSMTEYALILAAIAVIAFATYKTLGNDIVTLLTTIAGDI